MSTTKKPAKSPEEMQAALQKLIAQGRKEGMIRAADLNAHLEKMDLTPEKIEEIYDQFEAMNIQVITGDLDLDLGDDLDITDDLGDDIDLSALEEEELVDPVDLAAEYNLDDPVRMYLKEIGQIRLLTADEEGGGAHVGQLGQGVDDAVNQQPFLRFVIFRSGQYANRISLN